MVGECQSFARVPRTHDAPRCKVAA